MLRFGLMVEARSVRTASNIRRKSAVWTILLEDVSVKVTNVCIVDDAGKFGREVKVVS